MPSLLFIIPLLFALFAQAAFGSSPEPHATKTFVNSLDMEFKAIPAGSFLMGSPPDEPGRDKDEIQVQVTFSKGFYIQTTEVTQGQWKALMQGNPSLFQDCGDQCPVENVSWEDVQKFIRKLNRLEKSRKYRLPTEAEWEYVCRAGSRSAFTNGDIANLQCGYDPLHDEIGWFFGNSGGKTQPVAQKAPNAWGIFDMHGNVWEWSHDRYSPRDPAKKHLTDPVGSSTGWGRVFRGGSCRYAALCSRCANRKWVTRHVKSNSLGFRLVMTEQILK